MNIVLNSSHTRRTSSKLDFSLNWYKDQFYYIQPVAQTIPLTIYSFCCDNKKKRRKKNKTYRKIISNLSKKKKLINVFHKSCDLNLVYFFSFFFVKLMRHNKCLIKTLIKQHKNMRNFFIVYIRLHLTLVPYSYWKQNLACENRKRATLEHVESPMSHTTMIELNIKVICRKSIEHTQHVLSLFHKDRQMFSEQLTSVFHSGPANWLPSMSLIKLHKIF